MMNTLPALFLGHGNPMNVLAAHNRFNQGFAQAAHRFARPQAILMVSAHWYGRGTWVGSAAEPELIYDFYGFPEALYQVHYPVSGSPELAAQVQHLLSPLLPVGADSQRGLDHGVWTVLKHLYPDADIPVVQLSLNAQLSAAEHFRLAQQLRPLREQGVLIAASGNIVHNLRLLDMNHIDSPNAGHDWAQRFRERINHAIVQQDLNTLLHYRQGEGQAAEDARLAVPTPEHYLPLLYVLAQRTSDDTVTLFNDELVGGALSMTSVLVH